MKRKTAIALLSALCAGAFAAGLAACSKEKEPSYTQKFDGENHWLEADDGTKKDVTPHDFSESGVCGCGYDLSGAGDIYKIYSNVTASQISYTNSRGNTVFFDSPLLGYADWIKSLRTAENAEKQISDVSVSGNDITLNFFGGGSQTVAYQYENLYTVTAKVSGSDMYVANVYFKIYYEDGEDIVAPITAAKTLADGKAYILLESGRDYKVDIADLDAISKGGDTEALPRGYTLADSDISQVAFENKNAEVLFNVDNGFYASDIKSIPYSRYYSSTQLRQDPPQGDPTEDKSELKLNVSAGLYSYLLFAPRKTPSMNESDTQAGLTDIILHNADLAAAGVYKIRIDVSRGSATLCWFVGSTSYIHTDENGIPDKYTAISGAAPAGAVSGGGSYGEDSAMNSDLYSGVANEITVSLSSAYSGSQPVLGVRATDDCQVTVTVERTGDVREAVVHPIETVYPAEYLAQTSSPTPQGLLDWARGSWTKEPDVSGAPVLMDVTGQYDVVRDGDGYYRVGTAEGPYLYVAVAGDPIERVSPEANLMNRDNAAGEDEPYRGLYQFTDLSRGDEYNIYKIDYNEFIDAYGAKANSHGLVKLNDELKTFLGYTASGFFGANTTSENLRYLLACKYYPPEGGIPAPGSGTESDPYVVSLGSSNIPAAQNGVTVRFTATQYGAYSFKSELALDGFKLDGEAVTPYLANGTYYVLVSAGEKLTFTATGVSGEIDVGEIDSIAPEDRQTDVDGELVDASRGTTRENAILVQGTRTVRLDLLHDQCADGLYIKFKVALGGQGTYRFNLQPGSRAQLVYNDRTYTATDVLEIQAEANTEYVIFVTDDDMEADDSYILGITKNAAAAASAAALPAEIKKYL